MVPDSPAIALGAQALGVKQTIAQVVKSRHDRAAEAHLVSGSRYGNGFGTQWRDLLDDTCDALTDRGFQFHRLPPGGHKIPVVNGCLLYVWRVPDNPEAVSKFAASPTRQSGFVATPPPTMLFEPTLAEESEPVDVVDTAENETMFEAVYDTMPLVLVMVWSTPRQLQTIEWAVAELDESTGKLKLHGQENIWESELVADGAASDVESFATGSPVPPAIEPRKKEGTDPDAR